MTNPRAIERTPPPAGSSPAGVEPGRRAPAPGYLRVVQQFINSLDIEAGTDEIRSPAALSRWLQTHGLTRSRLHLYEFDLERARRFRELLRALALANNGVPLDPPVLAELDALFTGLPFIGRLKGAGDVLVEPTGGGVDEGLGRLAAVVVVEMLQGRWVRLKACARDACRWAFYDHSRNRSGTWCAMAVCGSRVKVAKYHRRRRRTARP
jgi:predicted RNA-binding Zn ribbon-like protein